MNAKRYSILGLGTRGARSKAVPGLSQRWTGRLSFKLRRLTVKAGTALLRLFARRAAFLGTALFFCAPFSPAGSAATREVPRMLMPPGAPAKSAIHWWDGEKLDGELTGMDADFLVWKSSLFTDPLRVRKEVIRRVDFRGGFLRAEGSFRIALADGSHLTGELEGADEHTLTIQSPLCGKVLIKRDQLVCLERISGEGIIVAGPLALLPVSAGARSDGGGGIPLFLAAAGRTATPAFNLASQRPLDLPDKCLVELLVRSGSIPDFSLKMADGTVGVSVETWNDELVLLYGDRFASAGTRFTDKDRQAHVRVAWDRTAERCALYGPDGKLWAEITPEKKVVEPEKKPEPKAGGNWLRKLFGGGEPAVVEVNRNSGNPVKGITLLNKGSGIIVERFCISEWPGTAPPAFVYDAACVETDSGVISGEPAARNGDALVIRTADGNTREVALASVRAIRWPRTANLERDPALTDLWFADGNLLRGKLTEVKDNHAIVETGFAAAPVVAVLKHCHAIVLSVPDKMPEPPPLDKLDVITADGVTLHGTIEPAGGVLPHFLPVGAEKALSPADAKDLSMVRRLPADGKYERAPALLHVTTGESLPVTLRGVSRDRVEFTWDAAEVHELKTSELHAVQFAAPAADRAGFDGHGWHMIGDPAKGPARKGESIVLRPGSGIGNPFLLQGGDISFQMGPDDRMGLSTLRIRLFCQGTDRDSNSLNFIVGNFGSQIYCGIERTEGQLETQTEVPARGVPVVKLTFPGDKVEMYVNGVRAAQTPLKGRLGRKSGNGIIIETASLWGNQVGSVKLSNLVMQSSPCMAGPPIFSLEARREALLLPRLRRDDPPRHVLIGRNGDLLRGEIEAMTATHLSFRAGLENFKVPLDRVAAAVWVKRPEKPGADNKTAEEKVPETKPAGGAGNPAGVAMVVPAGGVARKLLQLFIPLPRAAARMQAAVPAAEAAAPAEPVAVPKQGKTAEGKPPAPGTVQWLDLTNGGRIALRVESWGKDKVVGRHELLGRCSIPAASVYSFTPRAPGPGAALAALADWKLEHTPDPVLPEDEGGSSPLIGKPAASFSLPMLEGGEFSLSRATGKVVVLDFWATWCGPCVKSLPGLIEAMAAFPEDQVVFIAVNQGETKEQVQKFLEARELSMAVAFDADAKVARQFGVEGIPHTVVIDREGKIAFAKTGYEPDGDKKIAEAVRKAMSAPTGEGADKPKESGDPKPADTPPDQPLLPAPELQ